MHAQRRAVLCLVSGLLIATAARATAPVTSLTFSKLDFAPTAIGAASNPQKVILTNTGSAPLALHVTTSDESVFPIREDCPASLDPGERCGAVVVFIPSKVGPATGTIDFGVTGDTPHLVPLSGAGVNR